MAQLGSLIVSGASRFLNNIYGNLVGTVNGYTVGKSVPSDAKFTDTVTTATTSGSGNAVTAISATNGALTVTKGSTFLTSHQDISGKADKSATVSTVSWDSTNKKLAKTINGTTSDIVTGATILGGLTKSQVTTALGYTPPTTDTTYTFDGTYNSSTNKAATVSTVTNAIAALDGNLNSTTPGAGKTLTAFSQTDGKVSATFGNISITKSQVSDFPTSMTPTSHTHGNIQNGGTLQTTDVTAASGDKLVITDASDSNKVARTSIAFDGSTATKALTQKGTWETFLTEHQDISGKANLASPTFSGTPKAPTASAGTNDTQIATTAFVMNAFQANDAMVFKGTIGSSGATVTALPNTHYQGWTYRVITAGTYAGKTCEIGDMIICVTDGTTASNDHWTVVQANIDGAVTGPASATDAHVATFNGASGKTIQDSGFTIGKSVPSDAKFTDTTYTFDGTYNSSTNKAATVSTVTNAIAALDGNLNSTTPGTGKTLSAFSQTDGKVSATFANISITKSQVSDFPTSMTPASHTHGNIQNAGTLQTTDVAAASGDKLVVTDASDSNKVARTSIAFDGSTTTKALTPKGTWETFLQSHQDISGKKNTQTAVSDPTASGNSLTFIATISQNAQGVIAPTKKTVTTMTAATSAAAGSAGLVPAPASGAQGKFLRGDGTWAKPTDTKNTAGSTDSSSKLFLIGATSQAANPQTYSHDTAYVGTDGCLYSNSTKVLTSHQTIKQDGITGATVNRYCSCSAAASVAAKTANPTNGTFTLESGARVIVNFANDNTADNPTLSIGSTTAKSIYLDGTQITTGTEKALVGGICEFVYDGTGYNLISSTCNCVDTFTSTTDVSGAFSNS